MRRVVSLALAGLLAIAVAAPVQAVNHTTIVTVLATASAVANPGRTLITNSGITLDGTYSVTVTAEKTPGDPPYIMAGNSPSLDGTGTTCVNASTPCTAPGLPAYTLIAKVDGGAWQYVGPGPKTLSGSGTVYFAYNDGKIDDNSGSVTVTITYDIPPTSEAGANVSGSEGSAISLGGSGSDADGDTLTYAWTVNAGAPCTFADAAAASTTITCADNGAYTATLTVGDGGSTVADSTTVTVANVAPDITSASGPVAPVALGTSASVDVTFSDPGTLDTHTCSVTWEDVAETSGTIAAATTGCTLGHTYDSVGVYPVKVTVTDKDGDSDTVDLTAYIVVYDPTAGFVTGGGWIMSPAGAYAADPTLGGKATFGFVSKYAKGATVPSGNTQFQFHAAGMNFSSTSYDWLVIAGARAQYKGLGTINGVGGYQFLLTAVDGQVTGGGGSDLFRLKIWNGSGVAYDNQMDTDDAAAPTTALDGGSIVVHLR